MEIKATNTQSGQKITLKMEMVLSEDKCNFFLSQTPPAHSVFTFTCYFPLSLFNFPQLCAGGAALVRREGGE